MVHGLGAYSRCLFAPPQPSPVGRELDLTSYAWSLVKATDSVLIYKYFYHFDMKRNLSIITIWLLATDAQIG